MKLRGSAAAIASSNHARQLGSKKTNSIPAVSAVFERHRTYPSPANSTSSLASKHRNATRPTLSGPA